MGWGSGARRLLGLAAMVALGTLAVICGMLLPTLIWLVPAPLRNEPVPSLLIGLALVYGAARGYVAFRRAGSPHVEKVRALLGRIDALADQTLAAGRLEIVGGVACGLLLATWVPHYLTWPWWRDLDTFATIAQAWDAGIRPYRDIYGYNFPGQIYLFWILGKTVGWGKTPAVYVVDAGMLVALGTVLAGWSRRRFGRALPGLWGYGAFLWYYLSLEYSQVAQRDWQAVFFAVFGLLALEAWPGRRGWVASALALATALVFRPHVVLFLPAMVLALDEAARGSGEPWSRTAKAIGAWALMLCGFLIVAFAPLWANGLMGDFVRGVRLGAYGGGYSRATLASAGETLRKQLEAWRTSAVLVSSLALASVAPKPWRRLARTWLLALIGALGYRAVHPVHHHSYLALPLTLVESVNVALGAAWLLEMVAWPAVLRLLALAMLLLAFVPGIPRFCSVVISLKSVPLLLRGDDPPEAPPGCTGWIAEGYSAVSPYLWSEYRAVLAYLRERTHHQTRVANVLRSAPYPSLNGPTGRLTVFHAESGILWMWSGNIDLEPWFTACLEQTPDSVVVWVPGEAEQDPILRLERLTAAIRRLYEPEKRFGIIEVWRRKAGTPVSSAGSIATRGPQAGLRARAAASYFKY